jgi:hypothetical protein
MNRRIKRIGQAAGALLFGLLMSVNVIAGENATKAAPAQTLITNASVFDGKGAKHAGSMNVLIEGNKKGNEAGLFPGPRIWPSGAFFSQTGGHGDFRPPNDLPAREKTS